MSGPRILLLDIETAPNLAYVWGIWQENVPIDRIVDSGYVLCFSAKWLGDEEVHFASVHEHGRKRMLKKAHAMLSAADVVVHYNGKSFDIPTLNKEFALEGMLPPSPYKQVDLLKVVRNRFRFVSNKLDFIVKQMGLGAKVKHAGFTLWVDCMRGDAKAWASMESYNKGDVIILERLYKRILPWIINHPNVGLYSSENTPVCSNCGGVHLQRRGYATTAVGRYARYQCVGPKGCGAWNRGAATELLKEKRESLLRAAA